MRGDGSGMAGGVVVRACVRAGNPVPAPYQVKAKSHDDYCAKTGAAIFGVELENAGIIKKNSRIYPRPELGCRPGKSCTKTSGS